MSTYTMYQQNNISVIIPAHNEEASIAQVIKDLRTLDNECRAPLIDHIIVCDNASSDNTALIAKNSGAQVIYEEQAGYGAACLAAISAINTTDIVVFVDGDASVKTNEIYILLDALLSGVDLAIGSRVKNQQERQSLFIQQSWGNALITSCIRWLWSRTITDLGPFRAISYHHLQALNMRDQRFGWTTEMQIKAFQQGLVVEEYPVSTRKRIGKSKISGTLKGTFYAGFDMFSTIATLWVSEKLKRYKYQEHYEK